VSAVMEVDIVAVVCRLVDHHTAWAAVVGHYNFVLVVAISQHIVVSVDVIGQDNVSDAVIGYCTVV